MVGPIQPGDNQNRTHQIPTTSLPDDEKTLREQLLRDYEEITSHAATAAFQLKELKIRDIPFALYPMLSLPNLCTRLLFRNVGATIERFPALLAQREGNFTKCEQIF